ncbi:MAG: hypothetical protein HYZ11_10635 [Candidatus Tectomicrobia bacterium]|uniref:Uncharacterized protein n=1 Tax=Tectimicrobiota bacterium TaxID=2528274 RepID=A0A932MM98_UNCTE|nr:hypothetical protein [Candidatus Tectomicrobia bacterium]
MINASSSKIHWNYFIALERDLEVASRYVEFCQQNFNVYSIEFAHLLFAAASEVDVVAKLLCQRLQPDARRHNIDDYKAVLLAGFPNLPATQVFVPRYSLDLKPWDNWAGQDNPLWWRSYNNVKHERQKYFGEATFKNALNALGALLILVFYYYSYALAPQGNPPLSPKDTTRQLQPESTLLRLDDDYYYFNLIG